MLNKIASVYSYQGGYGDALEWCVWARESSRKAASIDGDYMYARQYGKYLLHARRMGEATRAVRAGFGRKDPLTLTTFGNIAHIYRKQGRYSKALELLQAGAGWG